MSDLLTAIATNPEHAFYGILGCLSALLLIFMGAVLIWEETKSDRGRYFRRRRQEKARAKRMAAFRRTLRG